MTKKKNEAKKKLGLSIAEVENGFVVKINTSNDEYDYTENTHIFLTSNALVDFIEKLI